MAKAQVEIEIKANLDKTLADFDKLKSAISGIGGVAQRGFSQATGHANAFQQQLRGIIGRFSGLWAAFHSLQGVLAAAKEGFDFNAVIEDAKLGMAALFVAQANVYDGNKKLLTGQEALTAATEVSERQINKLRIAGLSTAATTEQLVRAYQEALAPGLKARLTADQIRELTVLSVQAAKAIGVPMNQLNQEIRTLLEGTVDRNSRVAVALFGSPTEANKAIQKWKESGKLFEELTVKMKAFGDAGRMSMYNWSVILSNLKEATQFMLGQAFFYPMQRLKREMDGVLGTIFDLKSAGLSAAFKPMFTMIEDIATMLGEVMVGSIKTVMGWLHQLAGWWGENRRQIMELWNSIKSFSDILLNVVVMGLGKLVATVVSASTQFGFLSDVIGKLLVLGLGVWVTSIAKSMALLVIPVAQLTTKFPQLAFVITNVISIMTGATSTTFPLFIRGLLAHISPIGLLVTAVVGLTMAWSSYIQRKREAMLLDQKEATDRSRNADIIRESLRKVIELDKEYGEARKSNMPVDDIRSQQEMVIKQLSDTFPAWTRRLQDAMKQGKNLQTTIGDIARMEIENSKARQEYLRRDIKDWEARDKAAQEEVARDKEALATIKEKISVIGAAPVAAVSGPERMIHEAQARNAAEGLASKREALRIETQNRDILYSMLKTTGKITVEARDRVATEKELKELERAREQRQHVLLMLDQAKAKALPTITAELKEQEKIAEAELWFKTASEKLDDMKHLKATERVKAQAQLEILRQDTITKIKIESWIKETTKYLEEETKRQQKLIDVEDKLEVYRVSKFDARMVKLKAKITNLIDEWEKLSGKAMPEDEKSDIMNRAMSSAQQDSVAEMQKKANEWVTLREKALGYKLSITETIAAIEEWGQKEGFTKEQVSLLTDELEKQKTASETLVGGMKAGWREITLEVTKLGDVMKNVIKSLAKSWEGSMSTFFQSFFEKGKTGAEKWDALWKGMADAVLKAIGDMVAAMIMKWGVQKAIAAWEAIADAMGIARATTQAATTLTGVAANAALTESFITLAGAEYFAAHAYVPFAGFAIAEGFTEAMMAAMVAAAAQAKAIAFGSVATGMAVGGLVTSPQLTVLGERGPELVAPESTFLDWVKNVGNPALAASNNGGGTTEIHVHMDGAVILDSSHRGKRVLGEQILEALREVLPTRTGRINPGIVWGGK